jgi:valyl-tRNA synthetase
LDKEIDKISNDAAKMSTKLSNEKFVSKAPAEVVAKERLKLADLENSLHQLTTKRNSIVDMA